ncbi:TPA: hypothetical protein ACUT4C_005834 [Pseudomonas aeruginosa]
MQLPSGLGGTRVGAPEVAAAILVFVAQGGAVRRVGHYPGEVRLGTGEAAASQRGVPRVDGVAGDLVALADEAPGIARPGALGQEQPRIVAQASVEAYLLDEAHLVAAFLVARHDLRRSDDALLEVGMAGEEGLLGGEGALARLRAAIVVQARRIDPFQGLAAALPVGGLPALEQAEDFAFGGSLDQRWVQAEERGAEYRAQESAHREHPCRSIEANADCPLSADAGKWPWTIFSDSATRWALRTRSGQPSPTSRPRPGG